MPSRYFPTMSFKNKYSLLTFFICAFIIYNMYIMNKFNNKIEMLHLLLMNALILNNDPAIFQTNTWNPPVEGTGRPGDRRDTGSKLK